MTLTDLFDEFYCYIGHRNPEWRDNLLVKSIRVAWRNVANVVLPLQYRLTAKRYRLHHVANDDGHPQLIVSLTSFPARINRLWLVVESLLRQTHQPDRIILWLSRDQFPTMDAVPASLRKLCDRGLQIELREGDIRSHKKYYYTQTEYPEDIMVTVDDDIFYHSRMLEMLWEKHLLHPEAIISNHSHQLVFDNNGDLASYAFWHYHSDAQDNLFFIGAGGNLFPPHALAEEVKDIEAARSTCPAGDDIWLNAMAHLAHTPIIHSRMHGFTGLPVINQNNVTLCSDNVLSNNGNDQQIERLNLYFQQHHDRKAFTLNTK